MGYMIFLHISVCQPCQMAIKFKWKKNEILTEMRKSLKKRHPNAIYQYLTQEPLTTFTEHLSPLVFLKLTVVFFKSLILYPDLPHPFTWAVPFMISQKAVQCICSFTCIWYLSRTRAMIGIMVFLGGLFLCPRCRSSEIHP